MKLVYGLLSKLKHLSISGRLITFASVTSLGTIGSCIAIANEIPTEINAPHFHWPHDGFFDSIDYASARRGFQVYKEVCSACHGLKFVSYRHLIDSILTREEAIEYAKSMEYEDGPDDDGNMFKRPGKLTDTFKEPYANVQIAKIANNGAAPPDLSLIRRARHGFENYIFSLLTGYCDPPAGIDVGDSYFNCYKEGKIIAMAPPLYDDQVEYEDGTPATVSQMAKDVSEFLSYVGEIEHDDARRLSAMALTLMIPITITAYLLARRAHLPLLGRVVEFRKLDWKK